MSFSTSKVTVQWSLRFEFFTTPEGTDPARYASVLNICMLEQCSHLHIFANFFHEDVVLVSFSNCSELCETHLFSFMRVILLL